MFVWRVTRTGHAEQPLTGEGARRFGGRWNHVGTPVVYASGTLSLAVLEYLVNLPISDLPADLVSVEVQIPDDLPELKDIGTDWSREAKTAILVVPSVVIPNELNYLINPAHPLTKRIKIVSVEPFALDARLYRTRKPTRKPSRKAIR